jgi:hypothetical protein
MMATSPVLAGDYDGVTIDAKLIGGQQYEVGRFGESSAYNRKHSLKMAFYSGTASDRKSVV